MTTWIQIPTGNLELQTLYPVLCSKSHHEKEIENEGVGQFQALGVMSGRLQVGLVPPQSSRFRTRPLFPSPAAPERV